MRRALAALVCALAGACGTTGPTEVPPLAAPRVATAVRHAAGSPLEEGSGTAEPGTACDALEVTALLVALDGVPEELLGSLASQTVLLVAPDDDRPLAAAGSLAAGGRAGEVASADAFLLSLRRRRAELANLRAALPDGVTATFEAVRDAESSCEACEPVHERFAVHVHRHGAAIELAVDLEDTHPKCQGGRPRPNRELACLAPRGLGAFAVIVPSPFHGDEARAMAAVVEVSRAPDVSRGAAHAEAFARCVADLAREAALRRARAANTLVASGERAVPDLRLLADDGARRSTLLALARAEHCPLAEDVALSGSEELVSATASIVSASDGWSIERAALGTLAAKTNEDGTPPDVAAIVARRGGAAGTSAEAFFALASQATSLETLEALLVSENTDLLEDPSPAVRVRAFEWLAARQKTPAGYAPLAPAEKRRAALEKVGTRDGK